MSGTSMAGRLHVPHDQSRSFEGRSWDINNTANSSLPADRSTRRADKHVAAKPWSSLCSKALSPASCAYEKDSEPTTRGWHGRKPSTGSCIEYAGLLLDILCRARNTPHRSTHLVSSDRCGTMDEYGRVREMIHHCTMTAPATSNAQTRARVKTPATDSKQGKDH